MTPTQRAQLTAVARGQAAADLYLRGATLLNVHTGELYPANVAIKGERIAYTGLRQDMVTSRTRVLDVAGRILTPGYIDPHSHPAHLVTPSALARHLLPRVEGHTAGAASEKIAAIAAAGFTSDHEPITAGEVLDRARQGIAVMLSESSLRPDLVGLLDALKEAPALAGRAMLTADGSMPAFIRDHGFVDHLIRVALERGVPPVDAYRMASLNAATYFGLDADLGSIAPGRWADLCVLRDLSEPADFLSAARLTPRGVWDVKRARVRLPARRRFRG